MTAIATTISSPRQSLQTAIAEACSRIAPTWPLDQFIAVNPYWGWRQMPIERASATLGGLCGTRLLMTRSQMRIAWQDAGVEQSDVESALQRLRTQFSIAEVYAALESEANPVERLPLIVDLCGSPYPGAPEPWSVCVTHQISQHCAAYFDEGQAPWHLDKQRGLYGSWKRQISADRGLPWKQGRARAKRCVASLPDDAAATIAVIVGHLKLAPDALLPYFSAALLSMQGWAAWCAYQRWQAQLAGAEDQHIVDLLAMRISWDWLLYEDSAHATTSSSWTLLWKEEAWQRRIAAVEREQALDWVLQWALELRYQRNVITGLQASLAERKCSTTVAPACEAQAVFCIDVRSEVFRRALERVGPSIQTRGFAGFFGLPIAYQPIGADWTRPQLPGLLAPTQTVSEQAGDAETTAQLVHSRRTALHWSKRWAKFRSHPSSTFSFVEIFGLSYAAKLWKDGRSQHSKQRRWEDTGLPKAAHGLKPAVVHAPSASETAAQLQGILKAMGLVEHFAPLVFLVGHGGATKNNPHASGLDCGACGGQSGEINVRVLAAQLNQPAVRDELSQLGVHIPSHTHFIPTLHNTTTDAMGIFDAEDVPAALHTALARCREAFTLAGHQARAERAAKLQLEPLAEDPSALQSAIEARARDWAEVRPEWALADNAAFLIAPRAMSAHMNLGGRSFLHDYDWRLDPGFKVLELILTAPMIVTNWINLQYYASTVDNQRYGSGNKVLHNVVGGHIGVFEGNGGDLRIGLSMQSLHDGTHWRHTPQRLSVFVAAPREAIEDILERHQVVRDLVQHHWLHLLRIDADRGIVESYHETHWIEA